MPNNGIECDLKPKIKRAHLDRASYMMISNDFKYNYIE